MKIEQSISANPNQLRKTSQLDMMKTTEALETGKKATSKRTYVLDTNILLNDPRAIYAFAEHTVVIPQYVIEELDEKKRGDEEINRNAREACRYLDMLTEGLNEEVITRQAPHDEDLSRLRINPETDPVNRISDPGTGTRTKKGKQRISDDGGPLKGIAIPGTDGELVILMDDRKSPVPGHCMDDKILNLVDKHRRKFRTPIVIVTKDVNLGLKALGMGFGRQNYRHEQVRTPVDALPVLHIEDLPANELFGPKPPVIKGILGSPIANGDGNPKKVAPGYHIIDYGDDKRGLWLIDSEERFTSIAQTSLPNLRTRNFEQQAALHALLNPSKTLVCLVGKAGTGKTLLAIGAALHVVGRLRGSNPANDEDLNDQQPSRKQKNRSSNEGEKEFGHKPAMRVIITRPTISMGKSNDLGFLPGTLQEKMAPWMQPIFDNLDLLLGRGASQQLIDEGVVQLQPLQHIRGRTLHNAILIVDESQNLSAAEVKTILTRAGQGCRVILTGDPSQIDHPFLDKLSNGLSYAADRMRKREFVAVVPLVAGERSELSAAAAEDL